MADQIDNMVFKAPFFMYLVGKSDQGKTYWIFNGLLPQAFKEKYEIHWVVPKTFMVEAPIAEQALKHKDYYIHPTKDLGKETMTNLLRIIRKNENKKLVIIDNFTFGVTDALLDVTTYSRKYNASIVFIGHSLFANSKISPRLREMVSYFVFTYMPIPNTYKKFFGDELFEIYKREITSKSYKFMILDLGRGLYSIGKLPDYKITLETNDQFKGISKKLKDTLKKLNMTEEEKQEIEGNGKDVKMIGHDPTKNVDKVKKEFDKIKRIDFTIQNGRNNYY
jgi:hypothetical protein